MQQNPLASLEGVGLIVLRQSNVYPNAAGTDAFMIFAVRVNAPFDPETSGIGGIWVESSEFGNGGPYHVMGSYAERGYGPWLYWTALLVATDFGFKSNRVHADHMLTKYSRAVWERLVDDGWGKRHCRGKDDMGYSAAWKEDAQLQEDLEFAMTLGAEWFEDNRQELKQYSLERSGPRALRRLQGTDLAARALDIILGGQFTEKLDEAMKETLVANPRAIPIDQEAIEQVAQELEELVHFLTSEVYPDELPDGPLNKGSRITVYNEVTDKHRALFVLLVGNKLDSDYYVSEGGFAISEDRKRLVIVYLNTSIPSAVYRKATAPRAGGILARQIVKVLQHEMTHALDEHSYGKGFGSKRRKQSALEGPKVAISEYDEYYNTPGEVRAHAREVLEELRPMRKHFARMRDAFGLEGYRIFFDRSDTWNDIKTHLTEDNQRYVINVVLRELDLIE